MRISPKKRAANRRNALQSTGPKTARGRRMSALNATLHGLSVPLPAQINDPLRQDLADIIQHDGIDADTAHELAQKVIDYERNLVFLRHVFVNDMIVVGVEHNKDPGIRRWQEGLEEMLADIHAQHLKGMPWEAENMVRLTSQMSRLVAKTKKKKTINSRRYFKRSSNQLIKALRRL